MGRLASYISKVLRGKNKPTFNPHIDNGDFIVREKHGQSGDGKVNRESEPIKFRIKKSVSRGKFFPHESRSESIIQDKSQIFVGPLIINSDRIKRKNTVIPIYAGASNIG